jgi:hypothetical protein
MLFVSVGLLVACAASAQSSRPALPKLPVSPAPDTPAVPVPLPAGIPEVPREKTTDDLLAEIEQLRAQKAELDKKEQELTAALRKKLDAQAERLKKLGLAPKEAKEPDRVGRIIIEGNTKTPDFKILDALDLRPGNLLRYPDIEKSRAKLEKLGLRDVMVEVLPNELDSSFKDIRVKVIEPPAPGAPPVPALPDR